MLHFTNTFFNRKHGSESLHTSCTQESNNARKEDYSYIPGISGNTGKLLPFTCCQYNLRSPSQKNSTPQFMARCRENTQVKCLLESSVSVWVPDGVSHFCCFLLVLFYQHSVLQQLPLKDSTKLHTGYPGALCIAQGGTQGQDSCFVPWVGGKLRS